MTPSSSAPHEYYFELVSDSVMTRTLDGLIDYWNRSAEKLYGWGKEEAIGRVSHDLLQTQFPKPLPEIESELVRAGRWEGKLVHTTRSGGRVVVDSSWVLDRERQSRAVVEINRPSPSGETGLGTWTWTGSKEARQREPVAPGSAERAERFLLKSADTILAAGSLACALVLLYFLRHYGWTGMSVNRLLPALLAGLLLASLWLPPRLRIKFAILVFSTGVSTYLVEMATGLWLSLPSVAARTTIVERARVAKTWGVDFDPRTKLEVVTALRRKGVDAFPVVPAPTLLKAFGLGQGLLPLGGISNKTSVLCNEAGEYIMYESDEHGFHNPKGLWRPRIDIAAVGDSYVQGQCVPSDKNFVALIRTSNPATLNLGVAGQGPLTMLATISEYLRFVRPRIVLWFYYEGGDLIDLKRERDSPMALRYVKGDFSQNLIRRQAELDRALASYVQTEMTKSELSRKLEEIAEEMKAPGQLTGTATNAARLSHVRRALGLVDEERGAPPLGEPDKGDYTEEIGRLFGEVLMQAKTVVGEWGGQLYFVYLPAWSPDWRTPRGDRDDVMSLVRRLQIPIIDVYPAFQAHRDPTSLFPFRLVGHYNEEGQRVVATEVLRSLDQSRAIR